MALQTTRLVAVSTAVLASLGLIGLAVTRSGNFIDDSCHATQVKLFNAPTLLNSYPKAVRVVYVFDLTRANRPLVTRILRPPPGSLETFQLSVGEGEQFLTYTTGRIGDIFGASREVREMCLREKEDGFHLRTVRVVGDGVDVRVGPDAALMPNSRTLEFRTVSID